MFKKGLVCLGTGRYVLERSGMCMKGQVCLGKGRHV